MALTPERKRFFKSAAHRMRPLVQVGKQGFTPEVLEKLRGELAAHELVKLKVNDAEVVGLEEVLAALAGEEGVELVDRIGKTLVLFRRNPDNKAAFYRAGGLNLPKNAVP